MAFPTTATLDDFNRANATPPSASWSRLGNASADLALTTNQVLAATGVTTGDYWNPANFGPDAEAGITVATRPTNDGGLVILVVRVADPGSATLLDGYRLRWAFFSAAADVWRILRIDNSVATQLGADVAGSDLVAGDKIGFEVVGSTLTGYRFNSSAWASVISRTDTTYTAAGSIAVTTNDTGTRLDDFFGGTVVAGGGTLSKALAGAVTPGGVIAREVPGRLLAGGVTPAGAPARAAPKGLAGGVTPTGAPALKGGKLLAGSTTPTGAPTRVGGKGLGGSVTPAGAPRRDAPKGLAGTMAPVGAVTSKAAKLIGGAATPAGTPRREGAKALAGSTTPSGTPTRGTPTRLLAGVVTPVGSLVKQGSRLLAGLLAPLASIDVSYLGGALSKLLGGNVAPAGSVLRSTPGRSLSGELAPAGAVTRAVARKLSGLVQPAGSLLAGFQTLVAYGAAALSDALRFAVSVIQGPRFAAELSDSRRFGVSVSEASAAASLSDARIGADVSIADRPGG